MATVHFGRLLGPVGFARTVAIKRLHAQFASDPEFVSMFLDEARLAARIRHPNVVPTLDVVALDGELFLVMEYVQGEPLGALLRAVAKAERRVPVPYAAAIVAAALRGLHAAHEAHDEQGHPLGIVHRDISPQNIIVGVDGVARVLDFGVAKAAGRLQVTRDGQIKGKIAYMAPEQIQSSGTDRRTDVYAAGAVLWETLTGMRLFRGESEVAVFAKVMEGKVAPPSDFAPGVSAALDSIVACALSRSPNDRFQDARAMARALESALPLVTTAEIGEWVEATGADHLATRTQTVSRIELDSSAAANVLPDAHGPRIDAALAVLHGVLPPSAPTAQATGARADERTEISDVSVVHSAVIARGRRRWAVVAAAGAFALLGMGLVVRGKLHRAGTPAAGTDAVITGERASTSASPVPALSSPAPAPTPPNSVASAPPSSSSAGSGAPGAVASQRSIPPTAAPPSHTSPRPVAGDSPAPASTPSDLAGAHPHARPIPHPLETVLDSRK